jgi:hypothetical protein
MNGLKSIRFGLICGFLFTTSVNAHAATVSYFLDNVLLDGGGQMIGEFDWTYTPGDFEGGTGVFTTLEIPIRPNGSLPPLQDPGMVIIIEANQIEISLDNNFHDYGLDITMKFLQPLLPGQSSPLNLAESFYECCGNGFQDQGFQSGAISPVPVPAAAWLFGTAVFGLLCVQGKKT